MKILIDALGSDKGAKEIIKGTIKAMKEVEFTPILLGEEKVLAPLLEGEAIEIIEASEVIENNEEPTLAVRRKKNSSIVVGSRLLKEDLADGMFSCGSTGGLLASGLFIVGRLKGVDRASISIALPNPKGHSLVMDVGANMDSKPEMLLQFAYMGSVYLELMEERERPKVALLNVGIEEGKGNFLTKEAYKLLKSSDLNFIGNIEARDLFKGEADVIITDGFSGNVSLKTIEATVKFISEELREALMSSFKSKIGALLIKDELKNMMKKLDYRAVGGAPLLGLKKPLFKGHGSSDSLAVYNGILRLIDFIEKDVIEKLEERLSEVEDAR